LSNKPSKKSDLDKQWMKVRRRRTIRIQPEYHLIVCEGTKTEPGYFESIKNIINGKYRDKINLRIEGEGRSNLKLLGAAQCYVNRSLNPIQHVWLVYDKDDFLCDDFNLTEEKCIQLTEDAKGDTEYHALWSNQCIELWFLLHFIYFDSDISRDLYYEKLSEQMKNIGLSVYEKNRIDMYEILEPYRMDAIQHAKRLKANYEFYNPANMYHFYSRKSAMFIDKSTFISANILL